MSVSNYSPDWVSPPSKTLSDAISRLGITEDRFLKATGSTVSAAKEMLDSSTPIGALFAGQLEDLFGVSASFWANRQTIYNVRKALVVGGEA